MTEKNDLINRIRATYSLDKDLQEKLKQLSRKTGVPMSRMIEKALRKTYKL